MHLRALTPKADGLGPNNTPNRALRIGNTYPFTPTAYLNLKTVLAEVVCAAMLAYICAFSGPHLYLLRPSNHSAAL